MKDAMGIFRRKVVDVRSPAEVEMAELKVRAVVSHVRVLANELEQSLSRFDRYMQEKGDGGSQPG